MIALKTRVLNFLGVNINSYRLMMEINELLILVIFLLVPLMFPYLILVMILIPVLLISATPILVVLITLWIVTIMMPVLKKTVIMIMMDFFDFSLNKFFKGGVMSHVFM